MIELKHLAEYGNLCISERDINKLKGGKTYKVYHDKLGLQGKSKMVEVYVEKTNKNYLADSITGSLYDIDTLRCLTGDLYLV